MRRTAMSNYFLRAFLVLLAAATLAAGLLALVGAEKAWGAASRDFAPAQILSRGEAFPTVTADFNSDGKADLAGQKRDTDSVSVLLGNGDGTFQVEQEFAVGGRPSFVTSADFNADNKADLATANSSSSNVSVLLGNGDGTFQDAQNFAMATKPSRATSADFNADNKADLAVNNQDSDNVSVLLGNGDGTFQGGENFTVGDTPTYITSADLNADNKVDLATANHRSNNVSVLLGNGDGTFQGDRPLETGLTPRQVVAADYNGDEKADLATANWGTTFAGGGGISLSLGKGDGTFPDAKDFPGSPEGYPYHPYSLTAADFDEDGNTDLAATDTHPFPDNPTGVSVMKGTGNGAFHPPQSLMMGENPNFVIDVDLDADSYKDLVVAGTDQDLSGPTVVNTDYVAVLMNIKGPLDTSIDSGPTDDTVTTSGSATFSFSSSEDGSSFECSLDGSAWTECTSPKTVPDEGVLADDWHYFMVRATDPVTGTTDETPAYSSWWVEAAAPETTIDSTEPADLTNSTSASFSFSSNEWWISFQCKLDNGDYEDCSSPKQYTGLAQGSHTFSVKATDQAGNEDASPASHTWTVDTAPETTIDSTEPSSPTNSTSANFSFSSSESNSTFQCKLDNGTYESCSTPKQYTGLAQGSHTFSVKAIDEAGNEDASAASYTWTADTTAPMVGTVTPSNSATGVSRTTAVTASFSEVMDPLTLTPSPPTGPTVTLVRASDGASVPATVSYDETSKKVTLKPSSTLAARTKYTARVKGGTSGAKDKAGNPLASDKVWSFTTGNK